MNELQITLLVIAAVFLAGLYVLHVKRKKQDAPSRSVEPSSESPPESRGEKTTAQRDLFESSSLMGEPASSAEGEAGGVLKEENGRLVLEVEDDFSLVSPSDVQIEGVQSNFGRPAEEKQQHDTLLVGEEAATREPQLFAIMVIGTRMYSLSEVRNALLAIGMVYDEKEQIFVRKNEQGKIYLRAANALDPGTFPAGEDAHFATPGIALILQLPTCIHAPPAMDQMIRDARKLSQRLKAHLYNMDRTRINEPDLKKMRDAALDYVSVPLK